MGFASQSFQLNSTALCELLCRLEPKLPKKCRNTSVPFNKRLPGKLSHFAPPHFPSLLARHSRIFVGTCNEPRGPPHSTLNHHKDGPSQDVQNELSGHDQCCSSNPSDDVHNEHRHDLCISSSPSAAAPCVNGVHSEQSGPYTCVDGVQNAQCGPSASVDGVQNEQSGSFVYATSHFSSDDHVEGQHECTSTNLPNVASDTNEDMLCAHDVLPSTSPSKEANSYSDDAYQDAKGHGICTTGAPHDVNTSRNSSNLDNVEAKAKIRRFSLNEPGLLKTLQESRALTALEQENLDLLMKFKLTNNNLKGQLVIRAVRTEQLRDLENLLTDSYSELMWGPLTYRPVLAWILSTYLRERQAYLPHAVTLVGLYAPSEDSDDCEVSTHKWWLAGAVEISFNASGKPKDMQPPMPPEDAPFLSNMAVLKRFRRRGIGRDLLKAAEQLVLQMGGNEMYLHCRMIDEAPLNMYKNAGYAVVETDSILSLLFFQRRRHLMYKTLAAPLHQGIMVPVD